MKLLLIPSIAMVTIISISACTRGARTTSAHYIMATTSSVTFYDASSDRLYVQGNVGSSLYIFGKSANSDTDIRIWFNYYPGTTGSYSLRDTGRYGSYYPCTGASNISVHGSVNLTSVTPDIVGTFVFTRADSSVVSGSFDVPAP